MPPDILGGSFGTSISLTIWNNREALHQSHLVEHINIYNPWALQAINPLQLLKTSGLKGFGALYGTIVNQAFMLATNDIFRLSAWIFIFLLLIIWFARLAMAKAGGAIAAE